MRYKAAMFDFDGTVTNNGEYYPSQGMADVLVAVAQKVPIAFCTGRQLESFMEHGMSELLAEIKEEDRHGFLENLYLMAENGSLGYSFNPEKDEFEEFYRAPWPSDFVDRDEFAEMVAEVVEGDGHLHRLAHRVVVVISTNRKDPANIKEINMLSAKIYDSVRRLLVSLSVDFEQYLHIGNSGIGVVICPAAGDKDNGIREFAKHLESTRGMHFEDKYRDILVVGDQPQIGGNDHYFLSGELGTPYTVGNLLDNGKYPLSVFNDAGERLLHADGTSFLLRRLFQIK